MAKGAHFSKGNTRAARGGSARRNPRGGSGTLRIEDDYMPQDVRGAATGGLGWDAGSDWGGGAARQGDRAPAGAYYDAAPQYDVQPAPVAQGAPTVAAKDNRRAGRGIVALKGALLGVVVGVVFFAALWTSGLLPRGGNGIPAVQQILSAILPGAHPAVERAGDGTKSSSSQSAQDSTTYEADNSSVTLPLAEEAAQEPTTTSATSTPSSTSTTSTAVAGAQAVGDTFSLGGYRFTIPAYWRGRVDMRYGATTLGQSLIGNDAYDWVTFYVSGTDYVVATLGYLQNDNSSGSSTRWSSPSDWAANNGQCGGIEFGTVANIFLTSNARFDMLVPDSRYSESRAAAGGYRLVGEYDSDDVIALVHDRQSCGGTFNDSSRGKELICAIMASAISESGTDAQPTTSDSEPESDPEPEDNPEPASTLSHDSRLTSRTAEFWGVFADSANDLDYCLYAAEEARAKGFAAEVFLTSEWDNFENSVYVMTLICADTKEEAEEVLARGVESGYDNAYIKRSGSYVG